MLALILAWQQRRIRLLRQRNAIRALATSISENEEVVYSKLTADIELAGRRKERCVVP